MSIWTMLVIGVLFKLFLDSIKWVCEWRIRKLKPSLEHLLKLAENPRRPERYWQHGDEECPF